MDDYEYRQRRYDLQQRKSSLISAYPSSRLEIEAVFNNQLAQLENLRRVMEIEEASNRQRASWHLDPRDGFFEMEYPEKKKIKQIRKLSRFLETIL